MSKIDPRTGRATPQPILPIKKRYKRIHYKGTIDMTRQVNDKSTMHLFNQINTVPGELDNNINMIDDKVRDVIVDNTGIDDILSTSILPKEPIKQSKKKKTITVNIPTKIIRQRKKKGAKKKEEVKIQSKSKNGRSK